MADRDQILEAVLVRNLNQLDDVTLALPKDDITV